jgi:chromosomal replication initiator protein
VELRAQSDPVAHWRDIRSALRRSLDEASYSIWIEPLELKDWNGEGFVLEAPPSTQAWVAKRFRSVIESCAREVIGGTPGVRFAGEAPSAESSTHLSSGARIPDERSAISRTLNPRYSFEQFIIGDCNRLAHAAALAVAELPGQAYNPLFLHAPPGLGKTHLLHAIGNYVEQFGGGARVRYTTVEEFTNHFIAAIAGRTTERFKRTYRDVDVLLIDDVQFLASKVKTEEEFFHTFNALYENGRQLVFTADRLPSQLSGLSERLRERFEAGLVATLAPPDLATRITILRKRAALDGITLEDPTVPELIARRVTDHIRALEGALIRIVAHHSLTGLPLDARLAESVLDEIHPARPVAGANPQQRIRQAVCEFYELDPAELDSGSRTARINWPRQVAMRLTRELTEASLQEIGGDFGGRSHNTVLHACNRVAEQALVDNSVAAELTELRKRLGAPAADRHS